MKVAPSVLSVDYSNLKQDLDSVRTSDFLHIDIMDGHFVPNLTIGPIILKAIKKLSNIPLDVHLMVKDANFFIDLYKDFSPKFISIHLEEETHLHRLIQKLRTLSISPAVALNPHTRVENLEHLISELDMVLIMSVNPGFGGQNFIPFTLKKVQKLKELILKKNAKTLIEVDGGVNSDNIQDLKNAGCDIVVAGNYIFKAKNRAKAIESLRV